MSVARLKQFITFLFQLVPEKTDHVQLIVRHQDSWGHKRGSPWRVTPLPRLPGISPPRAHGIAGSTPASAASVGWDRAIARRRRAAQPVFAGPPRSPDHN